MRIRFLGVWGAYPAAGEANSAFLLEVLNRRYLVDCGSGVLAQLQRFLKLPRLDGVLLSHYHNDHVADIGVLQYAMRIQMGLGERQAALPVYGHSYDKAAFARLTYAKATIGKALVKEEELTLDPGLRISFLRTRHPVPCFAMRFSCEGRVLVYTSDTERFKELEAFSSGADLLIAEASLYNWQQSRVKGHMTGGEAGLVAQGAAAKRLVLTHFPHHGERKQLATEAQETFSGEVLLAASGHACDV